MQDLLSGTGVEATQPSLPPLPKDTGTIKKKKKKSMGAGKALGGGEEAKSYPEANGKE